MATVNDIDTKSAVSKFLQRPSVVDKEDPTADTSDETTAVLEAVAISFLLYPQAALCFVLQAKNVLQQVTSSDRDILDYLLKALDDVNNPDEPVTDTGELVEAQAALVEVDRIGRISSDVQAYTRYTNSINKFLDRRLSTSLKRRKKNELERSGTEAKQDLFQVLSAFSPVHAQMSQRLVQLLAGVDDFRSVSLTKIVSARAVARVRSSLNQVVTGIQNQQLSKTSIAIELLSGAAALSSISNSRDIYDPTIDTGTFPVGRTISVSSERIPAISTGTGTATSLGSLSTPWVFNVATDPGDGSGSINYSINLPATSASGRCYVKTFGGSSTFNIAVGANILYVQFDGITPPVNEAAMVRAVALPTGPSVTLAAVLSALNNVSTGLINGTAVQLANTGRIIIYGSSAVTKITIKNGDRGTFDGSGNYIPATGTVHDVLGFAAEQSSGDPTLFSPSELVDLITPYVPHLSLAVNDAGKISFSTVSTEILSSITFTGPVASAFGFSGNFISSPSFLELIENGAPIDPSSLGVFVGSIVSASDVQALSARNLLAPVVSIIGTEIHFADGVDLPRCDETHVRIVSPLVSSVQALLNNVRPFQGSFDQDARDLQRVLSPILSRPTLAQINDAKKGLQKIRDNVNDLLTELSSTVVRTDRSQFNSVAQKISTSLEERGLDKGLELLQGCLFSTFFSLNNEGASKGNRFLKATEQVGRNELAQPTADQDQNDTEPLGTTPDSNLLTGEELMEDEAQI